MNFYEKIKRIIFPKICQNCHRVIPFNQNFCSCQNDDVVRISSSFCEHCASEKSHCVCSHKNNVCLNHVTAPFVYTGIIKNDIHEFKFDCDTSLAKEFAFEMSQRVATVFASVDFDYLTFVPMTKESFSQRGINQTQILAKQISKQLHIPCEELLVKNKNTKKQHDLNAEQRQKNLENAFEVIGDVEGKVILLCDDIKTTGNTLSKCCDALLKSGAKDVYCVCIAASDFQLS